MINEDADVVRRALMGLALCDRCKLEFPKKLITDAGPMAKDSNVCPTCYDKYLASMWDTPLSGSTHNISGSAGKRLRDISFKEDEGQR